MEYQSSPKLNQACDKCRVRRVKCDRSMPCWRCVASGLHCSYSVAKRRGPKGQQSTVLRKLRERDLRDQLHVSSNENTISWEKLNVSLVRGLLDAYFDYVNPIVPILDRNIVLSYLDVAPTPENFALVAAAASTVFKRVVTDAIKKTESWARDFYMNMAMTIKGQMEYLLDRTVSHAKTAFLLYLSFCASEDFDNAWFFLHESITISRLLGLDKESHYIGLEPAEQLDHRTMFWGLYVSERGFSVHEHRPVVLERSIGLPVPSYDSPNYYYEFLSLVQLMCSLDDDFIELWNENTNCRILNQAPGNKKALQTLSHTQNELSRALVNSPTVMSGIQRANILITHPWLYLLLWRQSYDGIHSSPITRDVSIKSLLPVKAATVSLEIFNSVSFQEVIAHGPGMRKKFYDIGECLADFVIQQPELFGIDVALERCGLLQRLMQVCSLLSDDHMDLYSQLENRVTPAIQHLRLLGWIPTAFDKNLRYLLTDELEGDSVEDGMSEKIS